MIILGIDPGTTRLGYAFIKVDKNILTPLEYGILNKNNKEWSSLILENYRKLNELLEKFKPAIAAVEKLFFFKNQKTIISVSEMRGIIILTLALRNIPLVEYTPLQVKQAISNYGRADKGQVQRMVRLILKIKEPIKPDDAADALALAICCAHSKV